MAVVAVVANVLKYSSGSLAIDFGFTILLRINQNVMTPYIAEFFGTFVLVLLGDGVVAGVLLKDTKSENSGWLTIVVGWGLAVALGIYAAGRISGAHLNPAITLALFLSGDFPGNQVLDTSWRNVLAHLSVRY